MAYRHKLTLDEKRELLGIARAALERHANNQELPVALPHSKSLVDEAGAFVTLHNPDGTLRGCIGTQSESTPLYRTIQEMAVAAGSRDPRFSSVAPDELSDLIIEVSVLGDRNPISDSSDVEVGVHGVVITGRSRRGLLLPQVAAERGWSADTLLSQVCVKAGLADDAWRQPWASVERFTAQCFDETEFGRAA